MRRGIESMLCENIFMAARPVKKEQNEQKTPRSKQIQTPPQSKQIAELETRLEGMRDGEARIKRVEALQAQIKAGTYRPDSKAIAQKMLATPLVQRVLGVSHDLVDEFSPEEE